MAQCLLDSNEGLLTDGQSAEESPQHTTQQEAGESHVHDNLFLTELTTVLSFGAALLVF